MNMYTKYIQDVKMLENVFKCFLNKKHFVKSGYLRDKKCLENF